MDPTTARPVQGAGDLIVDYWHDSYAPCMVQARIRNTHERSRAERQVKSIDPDAWDDRTGSILLSWEDAEEMLPPAKYRDLQAGWSVSVRTDRWEAFAMYGYDCADLA
jgi:hypothetical protein